MSEVKFEPKTRGQIAKRKREQEQDEENQSDQSDQEDDLKNHKSKKLKISAHSKKKNQAKSNKHSKKKPSEKREKAEGKEKKETKKKSEKKNSSKSKKDEKKEKKKDKKKKKSSKSKWVIDEDEYKSDQEVKDMKLGMMKIQWVLHKLKHTKWYTGRKTDKMLIHEKYNLLLVACGAKPAMTIWYKTDMKTVQYIAEMLNLNVCVYQLTPRTLKNIFICNPDMVDGSMIYDRPDSDGNGVLMLEEGKSRSYTFGKFLGYVHPFDVVHDEMDVTMDGEKDKICVEWEINGRDAFCERASRKHDRKALAEKVDRYFKCILKLEDPLIKTFKVVYKSKETQFEWKKGNQGSL